eukprot:6065861-Pyramimonas_sp.AAC.1
MGTELNKLARDAKKYNLRTAVNPARRSQRPVSLSKEPKANEGGEVWFSQQHLECSILAEARTAAKHLRAPGSSALDGFLPLLLQQQGYAIVVIVLYAFPCIGMSGRNCE